MTTHDTEDFIARTTGWEARTQRIEGLHGQPSTTALATRSLVAADRLTGPARAEALRRHFEEYPPAIGSVCRTRQ